MSKAYVICDIEVTDEEAYGRYKELSGPSLDLYGGRYLVRGGAAEALEGDRTPHRVVIAEFDDLEAARRWYTSAEYTAARDVRRHAATASVILVDGC